MNLLFTEICSNLKFLDSDGEVGHKQGCSVTISIDDSERAKSIFAALGAEGSVLTGVQWQVAMRPGKRKALDKSHPIDALTENIEKLKASIRAKVEHPFRVIKRQFGFVKVRYRGLAKNTAQLETLFALSNLWMARRRILRGAQA